MSVVLLDGESNVDGEELILAGEDGLVNEVVLVE